MLRLKSAILLSVPSVSVSLFKPYCELFECFLGFHFDLFVAFFFFLRKLHTHLGAQTPNPKIKSPMLHSQPGAPVVFLNTLFRIISLVVVWVLQYTIT